MNVQRPPTNIPLGRQGENLATCIIFDCTGLAQLYGDGTAELLHELKSGTVYPVAIKQDGTSVSWIVTASDTATVGAGRAELRWYVGDTLAKSAKFRTSVSSALPDTSVSTPPAPQQPWVDKVLKAAQEIKDGAISDEKLAAAIAAYLEEHPIDAGLDEAALAAYLTENGYLTDAALADAIVKALADAKASGEFDGDPGMDGGYYTPSVDADGNLTWTASKADMPAIAGANIKGAPGDNGTTPTIGDNGNWYLGDTDTGKPSRGEAGVTPNIQIGTVETLPAESPATASVTGTPENPLLNLGIPKGADGSGGSGSDISLGLTGATVAQIAKVAAVDTNGAPTAWEPVDLPSGGEKKVKHIATVAVTAGTTSYAVTVDSNGEPLSLKDVYILTNTFWAGASSYVQVKINGKEITRAYGKSGSPQFVALEKMGDLQKVTLIPQPSEVRIALGNYYNGKNAVTSVGFWAASATVDATIEIYGVDA